jgi:alpha-N-arabinofuranosidase
VFGRWRGALLAAVAVTGMAAPGAEAAEIRIHAGRETHSTSPLTLGVNHVFAVGSPKRPNRGAPANWIAGRGPDQGVVRATKEAGIRIVRFPGGTAANLYDFKRAVRPGRRARCQLNGKRGEGPLSNVYGPDEHQRFVAEAGVGTQIMVPFANMRPQEAADWVEYMNVPVGQNPNGGVAWAQVRARNGHHAPYGIKRWEVGNEPDRRGQRYWLSRDTDTARRQYTFGGRHVARREVAGKDCRWGAETTREPDQRFRIRYAPVRANSVRVRVGERRWRVVRRLAGAGPRDRVVALSPVSGELRFGDGRHGARPPRGKRVRVSYEADRPGFVDIRGAMKAVDPGIDVCATWADLGFLELMRGRPLECLAVHPYTALDDFGATLDAAANYDAHMRGSVRATERMQALQRALPPGAYLATSEYGALGHDARIAPPRWPRTMIHALYMASQHASWMHQGLPWAAGGRLTDHAFGTVRGHGEGAQMTVAGKAMAAFGDMPGQAMVAHELLGVPAGPYPLLKVETTRTAGTLDLLVINRSRDAPIEANITLAGFVPGPSARVWRLTSRGFAAPRARLSVGERAIRPRPRLRFPPHSIVRVRFMRAG